MYSHAPITPRNIRIREKGKGNSSTCLFFNFATQMLVMQLKYTKLNSQLELLLPFGAVSSELSLRYPDNVGDGGATIAGLCEWMRQGNAVS